MPTGLYYTSDNNLAARVVGQSNHFHYVDNSTALELVQRLNVGGGLVLPVEDTGNMFRRWTEDVDYLLESGFKELNPLLPAAAIEYTISPPFVAPPKIYQTSRKLRNNLKLEDHFTWIIPVDIGFAYLLRLHFCCFGVEFPEGGIEDFNILIQNHVATARANVIEFRDGKRTPAYRDYLVMVKGDKARGKRDLFISLQPFDELVLGLVKGLEIYKLSNLEDSLASPNPYCPKHCSYFWPLNIRNILVSFGHSNVIVTGLTILLALVNFVIYRLIQIYEYTFWQEKNVESAAPDEPSCHKFSLTEILLATQDFNEALVIGKGGFGKVYKGFIHRRPEVLAIKRLKHDSKQGAREFWREIETLSKLRHVHLVSLLGYCTERQEMILVYEYMPRGTIADNLYKSGRDGKERVPLTWEQRLKICIGAARGLDYLHTGTQHSIIHRDVKDTNILLDENLVAKISDFGLSKFGKIGETQGELSTKVRGTIGYMDPDYLVTHKPSTKSDVYAFGIVLLVVLSGRPAVERRLFEETKNLLDSYRECLTKREMNEIIDPCLQGVISSECLTRFIEVVKNCLHRRPKKRPTMAQVVAHLENALETQIGAVPSTVGDDTVVGQNSQPGSNRSFEFYELQFAPIPKENTISLPREGNNTSKEIQKVDLQTGVEVSSSKRNDHKITHKPLWSAPWVSFRNMLKPSKKTDSALPTTPMIVERNHSFREWKHPVCMFSLKDIKLATKDFSSELIIGKGAFGTAYKGFIGLGILAIKRLSSTILEVTEEFQAEVELLSTVHYIHLVPFAGICYESNELIVAYDYMSHGTLKDHLYGSNQTSLTWEQRLKICIGAARGLNYLHELGFVHGDVRDQNIMLDENFEAKVSDYGLSNFLSLEEFDSTTRVVETFDYLDPRYFESCRLTKKSDVYSFGIVLLVVLSGMPAIDFSRPRKPWHVKLWYRTCSQEGYLDDLIDTKLVGQIPSASFGSFLELIESCLHEDQEVRPEMAQVVENLEEALDLAQLLPVL